MQYCLNTKIYCWVNSTEVEQRENKLYEMNYNKKPVSEAAWVAMLIYYILQLFLAVFVYQSACITDLGQEKNIVCFL